MLFQADAVYPAVTNTSSVLCFKNELATEGNDFVLVYKKSATRGKAYIVPGKRPTGRAGDPYSLVIKNASVARAFPPVALTNPANRAP